MKNTVAIAAGDQVFVSQHIGDLDTADACDAFHNVIASLRRLFDHQPLAVACDLHPDYRSTRFAREQGLPVVAVQHHHAHVLACMADNELDGSPLGVCWDGTGYGTDNTVWGGEFLQVTESSFRRLAHLRTFGLPGGERAIWEPRRAAVGVLYEVFGDKAFDMVEQVPVRAFTAEERKVLGAMLERGINCPRASSAGRLFDAVASLLGLRQVSQFEGQAAMELEQAADEDGQEEGYGFSIVEHPIGTENSPRIIDWVPLVRGIIEDLAHKVSSGTIAARFHHTLVDIILGVARRVGEERVVLTGGCFQNGYLTERTVFRLRKEGFRPYWHQRIPPNDGGIAVGQVLAAARLLKSARKE